MRIYAEQLATHLKSRAQALLSRLWRRTVAKMEAVDQIRQTANAQGFTERFSFSMDDNPN